jgi:hypothetical protein
MVIMNTGKFIKGLALALAFGVVLFLMFMPLFSGGKNALEYSDILFNSMAKGSTYYIPDLQKKNQTSMGKTIDVTLKFSTPGGAQNSAKVLTVSGAQVSGTGEEIKVKGDLGGILASALKDSDSMFHNKDTDVSERYGMPGREAQYVWWNTLKQVHKDLERQKLFKEADWVNTVIKKGVEVGYNFFGIEPQSASSKAGVLTFSLIFYVIYTLWWGIGILFLFEGFGLEMKKGAKAEH